MKTILPVFLLITLLSTLSIADIINVPADIDSIQGGINLANPGDTVLVQPGTYKESINFNGKNVVVASLMLTTSDTSYISRTVIHGNVTVEGGEDSTVFLCGFKNIRDSGRGFHIEDSSPAVSYMLIIGGPVTCINSNTHFSHVTIDSCVIIGRSSRDGGGIYCRNSDLRLTDVKIMNNEAIDGGGMYCKNSNPTLINVQVKNNYANFKTGGGVVFRNKGGGLYFSNSSPTLVDVIVSGNYSEHGGGIYCSNSNPSFSNVTITENNASIGGGILFDSTCTPIFDPINRCNIYNNNLMYDSILRGNDLYSETDTIISVVVDTFTVMNPDSSHAYPLNKFTFDIQNAVVTNISENLTSPTNFTLNQNYPNPFNPSTTIEFTLPKSEYTELKVYNILGKEVSTVVSNKLNQGNHTYTFDGKNLASGIYYYQLVAGDYREIKKMILLR